MPPSSTAEKWKRRTMSGLPTRPITPSQYETLVETSDPEPKTPRGLSRALRSWSNSSLDSLNGGSMRRVGSARRLQKTSASSSMIERFHRRVSKDFQSSISQTELSTGSLEPQFHTMEVLRHGYLKTDVSLLKARSEYLVVTDHSLIKFGSIDAARFVFPQVGPSEARRRSLGSQQLMGTKSAVADFRFEIPLQSIVAVFNEEGASPRSGIEIWWFSQWPRLAYCKAHLLFAPGKDRDEWLLFIQRAIKSKQRRSSPVNLIPDNLRIRINHIVGSNEPQQNISHPPQNVVFPVAKRVIWTSQKPVATEDSQFQTDGSSFYLVIGPYMCYFLEVLKADHGTSPGELRVKSTSFGTVTLTRFKASVVSHEQRFVMSFRPPFGKETRLDLASIQYRRIIEALTRMDRILKPMWPQHFQQHIFDVKGLPPPLQLTSGNDLGGIEQSLRAYCAAYSVDMPRWAVDWHHSYQPVFRLIPLEGMTYLPMQLMAVFRALRYNNFFKAISFRGVDLSSLVSKRDYSLGDESIVHTSINGYKISDDHYDQLLRAPVLTQELHSLAFASESIRSIDLKNVLGSQTKNKQGRLVQDFARLYKASSEMLEPVLKLVKGQHPTCYAIDMSENPVDFETIENFSSALVLDHVTFRSIKFARCKLGDEGLAALWTGLSGQGDSLDTIDTSDNQGTVKFELFRYCLRQLQTIRRLNVSGNTRLYVADSLFEEPILNQWELEELDLSKITLNDATIDVLCGYLESNASRNLETFHLNQCGLSSRQIARLFRCMGQRRRMTVSINGNYLDEGIDDLCSAISLNYGPWSLFIEMVEFNTEASFVKLWKALTANNTIQCLSLAGSATSDAVSHTSCEIIANFFSKNETVRYLDISGFDSRLDEGRLGREFSHTLRGVRVNKTIEHLRVRTQMLNINIGDLAEAVSGNRTLHTLDCEDNDFNLSNYRHLVKNLGINTSIRKFSAFTPQEMENVVKKAVMTAGFPINQSRRSSMMLKFRNDKSQKDNERMLSQQLKQEWDAAVAELAYILDRNEKLFRENQNGDSGASEDWDGESIFSTSFGGLALKDYEERRRKPQSEREMSIGISALNMPDLQSIQSAHGILPERSNSTVSSDIAISPISATGSFAMPDHPPSDAASISEKLLPPFSEPFAEPYSEPYSEPYEPYSEVRQEEDTDGNYTFLDGLADDSELVMQIYRRPWGETVSCIREEEDVSGGDPHTL